MEQKTCRKCQRDLLAFAFCTNMTTRDGLNNFCRKCCKKSCEKWRKRKGSGEKIKAAGKAWACANRDKVLVNRRNYRKRHPERAKQQVANAYAKYKDKYMAMTWHRNLKYKYGITEKEFNAFAEQQNHRCAICGTDKFDGRRKRFCVDHCHSTGVVRGLLCFNCNAMLGCARDSVQTLKTAIAYLERHPKNTQDNWLSDLEEAS